MINLPDPLAAFMALALLPYLWSALIAAARTLAPNAPTDREEKTTLTLMLAPIAIGALLILAAGYLPRVPAIPLPLRDTFHLPFANAGEPGVATTIAAPTDWLTPLLTAAILIYLAGAALAATRLIRASTRLRATIRSARAAASGTNIAIAETGLPPFASANGQIILPATLVAAAPQPHIDMIVAHERAHIRRSDPRYYLILSWIEAALWFNPFVRAQTARCRLAAELACDAEVIAQFFEQAPEMRRTYAQAIVSALKHAAGDALPCAPAAFSTRKHGEYRMRIANIMQAAAPPRKQRTPFTIAALIAAAPIACAQFAYAFDAPDDAPAFTSTMLDGWLSSAYGDRLDPFSKKTVFHLGVDIAAPAGTAVRAPAAGTITRAGTEPGYGYMIEIDHGNGYVTRYGHLALHGVDVGQKVVAGEVIADVGRTDRTSTGAHVHVEVYKDGETIDPASVLILPAKKD